MRRLSWHNLSWFALTIAFCTLGCFTSCISAKRITFFNDLPDSMSLTNPVTVPTVKYVDPIVRTNDILSITLQTMQQNETNTPITTSTVGTFSPLNGFLVDKNGMIELSLIGFVKVAGLTTSEIKELVKEKAKEYYKEPVVNCRISNFEVTILGDVSGAGTYTFPSEKVDLLEVLGACHDIALTAKRNNILLVRNEGDTRKFIRFNLNSKDVFSSPYFYMRQRDFIYVEPSNYKIQSSDQTFTRNLGIFSSVISLGAILLAFRNIKF